jgi:hypothetical protein
LAKKRISRSASDDLGKFLFGKKPQSSTVTDILKEVFTIRDVIAHNHLYSITFYQTDYWEFIGHRQKLLKGYGDPKFKQLVSGRTKRTKLLNLNAQPLKIGFEDLWLVLVIFDLLLRLADIKKTPLVFKSTYKFDGKWQQERGLSRLLGWYYDRIRAVNPKASNRLKKVLIKICGALDKRPDDYKDSFLSNRCPWCDEFGFRKPNQIYKCEKCGHGFELETIVERPQMDEGGAGGNIGN